MSSDERDRLRGVGSASLARLARSRDFRAELATLGGGDHRSNIIAVLPDDTMSFVWTCIDRGFPGAPTVLGVQDDECWRIALMWKASSARLQVATEDGQMVDVGDDAHVSMFLDVLERAGGAAVVRRAVAARLIDPREPQHS